MVEIFTVVAMVVEVVVLALVARRVLGVPVGWPRSVVVGLGMVAVYGAALRAILDLAGIDRAAAEGLSAEAAVAIIVLSMAWVFGAGVGVLVLAEMIAPTGSLPSPFAALAGWPGRVRRTRRYL